MLCGLSSVIDPVRMDPQKRFFGLCRNSRSEDSAKQLLDLLNSDETLELNVNCTDVFGRTPLILISLNNCPSEYLRPIVERLLERGADVRLTDGRGQNCLHWLCAKYSGPDLKSLVELMLSKGIDIRAKDIGGRNCLHLLCANYSGADLESLVERLLSKGIDIHAKDNNGRNCLHRLCANYSVPDLKSLVELLLSKGIDIRAEDIDGRNCLHLLCENYSGRDLESLVKLLLLEGIDINAKDTFGRNCLHWLCENYSGRDLESLVKLLLSKGIDIRAENEDGRNCLHLLCANYSGPDLKSRVALLLSKGINIDARDDDGWNCLHWLCANYSGADLESLVELMLSKGIDIHAKDDDGWNCLHYLVTFYKGRKKNLKRLVELLGKKNIDVSTTDESGQNLLLSLCREHRPWFLKSALQLVDARNIEIDASFRAEIEADIAEQDSGSDSSSSCDEDQEKQDSGSDSSSSLDEDQETSEREPSTSTNAEVTDAAPGFDISDFNIPSITRADEEDVQHLTADVTTSSSRGKEITKDTPGRGTKRKQSDNDAEDDGANGPPGSKKSASGSEELPDVPEASVSACSPCVPGDLCPVNSTTRIATVPQTATDGHDQSSLSTEMMIMEIYRRVIAIEARQLTSLQTQMAAVSATDQKVDELARQLTSLQTQMAAVSAPTQHSTTMPVLVYTVNSSAQAEQVHDLPSGSVMDSEQHGAPAEQTGGRESEEVDDRRGNTSEPQSTAGEDFVHDPVKFQKAVSQATAVLDAKKSKTLKDFVFRIMDSYFTGEYMRTHSCTQKTKVQRDGSRIRTPMDETAREAIYAAVREHPAFTDRKDKDVNDAIRKKLNNYRPVKSSRDET